MKTQPNPSKPLGVGQITGLSTVKTLADAIGGGIPTGARFAILQAEGQAVRYRDDGTDPTAAAGMILAVGDPGLVYDGPLAAIRFKEAAASATLNVAFYGWL